MVTIQISRDLPEILIMTPTQPLAMNISSAGMAQLTDTLDELRKTIKSLVENDRLGTWATRAFVSDGEFYFKDRYTGSELTLKPDGFAQFRTPRGLLIQITADSFKLKDMDKVLRELTVPGELKVLADAISAEAKHYISAHKEASSRPFVRPARRPSRRS